jgi:uncharacterized protein (TIGR02611 family)
MAKGLEESMVEDVRESRPPAPPAWIMPMRSWVLRRPAGLLIWRIWVAVFGGAIVLGGLLLIPLPGPGWLIVFFGVAVWATEFAWALRLLRFGRRLLSEWTGWAMRQPLWVRGLLGLAGLLLLAGLAYLGWRVVH